MADSPDASDAPSYDALTLTPIGVVHTPHRERLDAPRQPAAARDVRGEIHLRTDMNLQHAVEDLARWSHIWVIFWFHKNRGWRPKVLPPRGDRRYGVLATRSPHRPNPLGLSVLELERVEGLVLHVRGVDLLDGTPVLDVKPYVPYTDALPTARSGWLDAPADPLGAYVVHIGPHAREQLTYLRREHGLDDLEDAIAAVLVLGPQPHPYRRIRRHGDGFRLALKAWRVTFHVVDRDIHVDAIASGYRAKELAAATENDSPLAVHRAFTERFGSTQAALAAGSSTKDAP